MANYSNNYNFTYDSAAANNDNIIFNNGTGNIGGESPLGSISHIDNSSSIIGWDDSNCNYVNSPIDLGGSLCNTATLTIDGINELTDEVNELRNLVQKLTERIEALEGEHEPIIFPVAKKVFAKTVALDLMPVPEQELKEKSFDFDSFKL